MLFRPALRASWRLMPCFILPVFAAQSPNARIEQQLLDSVEKEVKAFVQPLANARYELSVRSLSRKTLTPCSQPLSITPVAKNRLPLGNVKRKVECLNQWQVSGTVEVGVFIPVAHSVRPLSRGQSINKADIQLVEVSYAMLRGQYYLSADELTGRRLKRTVSGNKLISNSMLEPDFLVRKGDSVMIQAGSGGLQVSMPGIALGNGRIEDNIRVKNRSSGKTIDAVVVATGKVKIPY